METEGFELVQLELKYCERCGGLWVRPYDSGEVYCPGCAVAVAGLPSVRKKRLRTGLSVGNKTDLIGQAGGLLVICIEGGNA